MSKWLHINQIVESVSITHKFHKPMLCFLNTSDIEGGKIVNINRLPIEKLKGQAKKTIKKDDILFSEIRPKNRRFAYVEITDTEDYVVSTKLMVLRKFNPEVDNKYFYYFVTSYDMLAKLQSRAENRICSFPQITFDLLSEYRVRIPELSEQQQIVRVLASIDAKIELNNKTDIQIEQLLKLLYDYWFVQFDFPDKNGHPYRTSGGKMVFNSEVGRDIPVGWKIGNLSDIAQITLGQSPEGDSYNDDGNGMVFFQGCTDFGARFPMVRQYTTAPTRFAKKDDFLLSVRAPVGSINIADRDCCIGRGLAALRSKTSHDTYLYGALKGLKTIFDRRDSTGTTFGSITKDDLFSLKVIIPEIGVLNSYKQATATQFNLQNKVNSETQELTKLRDWILPLLMNGQVKIN